MGLPLPRMKGNKKEFIPKICKSALAMKYVIRRSELQFVQILYYLYRQIRYYVYLWAVICVLISSEIHIQVYPEV